MSDVLTTEQISELKALLEKATPGPWDRDTENDRREETYEVLIDSNGKEIADTANSGISVIEYDSDEDGTRYWDETGYRNFEAISALRNAAPALIAMAERLAEVEAVLSDPTAVHANILRGGIKLSRTNALHIAGATDYDSLLARAEKAEAEATRFREMAVRLADALSGCVSDLAAYYPGHHFEVGNAALEDPEIRALLTEGEDNG